MVIEVDNVKMETTEIQADTVGEVAMHSAKRASDKLKCMILKMIPDYMFKH